MTPVFGEDVLFTDHLSRAMSGSRRRRAISYRPALRVGMHTHTAVEQQCGAPTLCKVP